MTLSGRPLLDNRVDQPLFVGREQEIAQVQAALGRGLNVLITGDAGVGRTSLLNALRYRARSVGSAAAAFGPVTYVRADGISDGGELLRRVGEAVLGPATGAVVVEDGDDPAGLGQLGRLGRLAGSTSGDFAGSPWTVIVDDVAASAGHALFGRLRDELWSLPLRWVVSARSSERGGLTLPPADAFFEEQLILPPVGAGDGALLLGRRLPDWPPAALDRVVDAIGGNPRALLDAVRAIADPEPSRLGPVLAAIRARNSAIARAGRPESMLAAELEAIGAASASDEVLLDRLGWTRARAVQVLTRLEALGLVRGEDVKLGRGRPRKVYRLVSPAEFELSVGQARMDP